MKVVVRHETLHQFDTEALIIFFTNLDETAILQVNGLLEGAISQQVEADIFSPTLGQVMVLPTFGRMGALHVVVVGWGPDKPPQPDAESALVVAFRKAYDWAADDMAVVLPPHLSVEEAVTLLHAAAHKARQYVQTLTIVAPTPAIAHQIEGLL